MIIVVLVLVLEIGAGTKTSSNTIVATPDCTSGTAADRSAGLSRARLSANCNHPLTLTGLGCESKDAVGHPGVATGKLR